MAAPLSRSILRCRFSSHSQSPIAKSCSPCHKESRAFSPVLVAAAAVLSTATYYLFAPARKPTNLNGDTFVPYTITSRDVISPSSAVFTISPHTHDPSLPYLVPGSGIWKYPLWSVEFKQPEVQIARHYTPLPPLDADDARDGKLRFYVRAVGGGEMSNYLNRLGVGRDVWLRGPHVEFDVLSRLGAQSHVVFLAGGTGLAPGLQVAKAVLEGNESSCVNLLWAVRKREEIQGVDGVVARSSWWSRLWRASPAPIDVSNGVEQPSAVARELQQMKARYGNRLNIRVAVDEEHTQFTDADIRGVLTKVQEATQSGQGCQLHDQRLQTRASEFEEPGVPCQCASADGGRAGAGKNLFMVSGPDGFIAHYAGEKVWHGGVLTQGPVGGVAGQLQRKDPSLATDWLVLKL